MALRRPDRSTCLRRAERRPADAPHGAHPLQVPFWPPHQDAARAGSLPACRRWRRPARNGVAGHPECGRGRPAALQRAQGGVAGLLSSRRGEGRERQKRTTSERRNRRIVCALARSAVRRDERARISKAYCVYPRYGSSVLAVPTEAGSCSTCYGIHRRHKAWAYLISLFPAGTSSIPLGYRHGPTNCEICFLQTRSQSRPSKSFCRLPVRDFPTPTYCHHSDPQYQCRIWQTP